jgi:hypothetical protein
MNSVLRKSHNHINVEKYETFLFHILTQEWIRYYYTLSEYICVSVSGTAAIYGVSSDSLSFFLLFISFSFHQPVFHLALRDPFFFPLQMPHILDRPADTSSLKKEIKSATGKESHTGGQTSQYYAMGNFIRTVARNITLWLICLMYDKKLMTSGDDVAHFHFS